MSKATYKSLQRARRLAREEVGQTKLERAIELYGKEDGRIMSAIHDVAISNVGTFSERLEMCNEIIELSK